MMMNEPPPPPSPLPARAHSHAQKAAHFASALQDHSIASCTQHFTNRAYKSVMIMP